MPIAVKPGITLASVALGMVGEKTAEVIMGTGGSATRYAVAIGVSAEASEHTQTGPALLN